MAGSTLFVVFVAALSCRTGAALTWNAPVAADKHSVSLAEGATKFTTPLTITATPGDASKAVTYELDPDPAQFSIAADTGTITFSGVIDFETTPSYTLNVKATEAENDTPITATVTITVTDVPTFAKATESVCIPDGATAGTAVTTLTLADTFNVGTVPAFTKTGTGDENFAVDATGTVAVAPGKTITKGDGDSYTLVLKRGQDTSTLTLTVNVGDCSAASILAPFGLLTLLMALIVSMN